LNIVSADIRNPAGPFETTIQSFTSRAAAAWSGRFIGVSGMRLNSRNDVLELERRQGSPPAEPLSSAAAKEALAPQFGAMRPTLAIDCKCGLRDRPEDAQACGTLPLACIGAVDGLHLIARGQAGRGGRAGLEHRAHRQ